jgi:hypothetical protein
VRGAAGRLAQWARVLQRERKRGARVEIESVQVSVEKAREKIVGEEGEWDKVWWAGRG